MRRGRAAYRSARGSQSPPPPPGGAARCARPPGPKLRAPSSEHPAPSSEPQAPGSATLRPRLDAPGAADRNRGAKPGAPSSTPGTKSAARSSQLAARSSEQRFPEPGSPQVPALWAWHLARGALILSSKLQGRSSRTVVPTARGEGQ